MKYIKKKKRDHINFSSVVKIVRFCCWNVVELMIPKQTSDKKVHTKEFKNGTKEFINIMLIVLPNLYPVSTSTRWLDRVVT